MLRPVDGPSLRMTDRLIASRTSGGRDRNRCNRLTLDTFPIGRSTFQELTWRWRMSDQSVLIVPTVCWRVSFLGMKGCPLWGQFVMDAPQPFTRAKRQHRDRRPVHQMPGLNTWPLRQLSPPCDWISRSGCIRLGANFSEGQVYQ